MVAGNLLQKRTNWRTATGGGGRNDGGRPGGPLGTAARGGIAFQGLCSSAVQRFRRFVHASVSRRVVLKRVPVLRARLLVRVVILQY